MMWPKYESLRAIGNQIRRYQVRMPNPSTPGADLAVGWVASKRFNWPGYRNGRIQWIAYVYNRTLPGDGAFVETTGGKLATYRTRRRAAEALVRVAGMASSQGGGR